MNNKSKLELEMDRTIFNINDQFWNNCGLMTAYRLGVLRTLENILKYDIADKAGILTLVETLKECDDVSNLVALILEEYGDKESNDETN